jgi:hypothetical protein
MYLVWGHRRTISLLISTRHIDRSGKLGSSHRLVAIGSQNARDLVV